MNNLELKAKLVLIQLDALQEDDFEGRTVDQLTLINEVLRSAKSLAEQLVEDKAA